MNNRLSPEQRERVAYLLQQGLSLRQIAKLTGTTAPTVAACRDSMKKSEDDNYSQDELKVLWRYCRSQSDAPQIIADLANISKSAVEAMILQRNGV